MAVMSVTVWGGEFFAAESDVSAAELFRTGHYTQARALYLAEVQQQRDVGLQGTRLHGKTLFDLGAASSATGDLAESVQAFRQSLAIFEKLPSQDQLDTALALEGLASVLLQQENLIEAREYLERALAIRQEYYPEHHPQLARLYALMASEAQLRGDYEGTEELYYKALMSYRRIHGNLHPTVAEIIQNLGTFYTETDNFESEIMYQQANDVGEALFGAWHPLRAVGQANFGHLRWKQGKYEEAEQHLRDALAIHDHLGMRSHPDLAVCLTQLGRVLLASAHPQEATLVLEQAAEVYESAWWRAGAGAERSLAVVSPYPLLAAAYLQTGKEEKALAAFQAHQGRLVVLSHRLQALPADLAARRDSLILELNLQEETLARLEREQAPRAEKAAARSALVEVEGRWLAFQNDAAGELNLESAFGKDWGEGSGPIKPTLGWVMAEVRDKEYLGWGFVARPGQTVVWEALNAAALDSLSAPELSAKVLADLQVGDAADLDELRRYALDPLAPHLKAHDDLVVIPSGFLAGFPVGLLLQPGQTVVYSPVLTPQEVQRPEATQPARAARVLVVADPPFSENRPTQEAYTENSLTRSMPEPTVLRSALAGSRQAISDLPSLAGTRREAEALSDLFEQTVVLAGAEASESSLRALAEDDDLGQFDIIHLATHALIDAERPSRSALVLSQVGRKDDPATDGLLTVREINRTWKLDARLVTLSACATALGRRVDGEGFLGFTQSLLGAGAQQVLVSLWPVDDQATAMLMERFYGNIAGSRDSVMSPASALNEARAWLRDYRTPAGSRPFAAPRYWAGFVLYGTE